MMVAALKNVNFSTHRSLSPDGPCTRRPPCRSWRRVQLRSQAAVGRCDTQELDRQDKTFMLRALEEAKVAFDEEEVPVGAVLVDGSGAIIATAHNQVRRRSQFPIWAAQNILLTVQK